MEKVAGKKQEDKAQLSNSYHIYDQADQCPLAVYIDMVCDNNLQALTISGNPPEEALQEARLQLTQEMAELSGSPYSSTINNCLRRIYQLRCQMLGINLSLYQLESGEDDQALLFLRQQDISIRTPRNEEEKKRTLQMIQGRLKGKGVRLREEIKRYEQLTRDTKGGSIPKRTDFLQQLAILSRHMGFRIDKQQTSVAEYATYLKTFKSETSNGKQQ